MGSSGLFPKEKGGARKIPEPEGRRKGGKSSDELKVFSKGRGGKGFEEKSEIANRGRRDKKPFYLSQEGRGGGEGAPWRARSRGKKKKKREAIKKGKVQSKRKRRRTYHRGGGIQTFPWKKKRRFIRKRKEKKPFHQTREGGKRHSLDSLTKKGNEFHSDREKKGADHLSMGRKGKGGRTKVLSTSKKKKKTPKKKKKKKKLGGGKNHIPFLCGLKKRREKRKVASGGVSRIVWGKKNGKAIGGGFL